MALLLYRILFPLAFLLAVPFYALRLWRRERGRARQEKPPGYQVGLGQRFGRYPEHLRAQLTAGPRPWWLCSISVGETLIALKLARALRAEDPTAIVVISVTTSTGYEMLLREAARLPWVVPVYNPIDFRFAARAAVRTIRPKALVLVEGGIWPNLLATSRQAGVPVVLACARLSPRSERRWRKRPALAHNVWGLFDRVLVPEEKDVERFAAIGVDPAHIVATGNIKFDNAIAEGESRETAFRTLVAPLGFAGPILVAGSTWAPEEKLLAATLRELRGKHPDLRLIVVPRHVERADEVEREFAGWRVVRRSQLPVERDADILIVDTTGELRDWYRLATVVFVGKSMPGVAEIGGQNAGEPAALGKAVVFGPHMENFAGLAAHLCTEKAAVQVASAAELAPAFSALLADPGESQAVGARAQTVLLPHQGAAQRTANALSSLQKV